MAVEDRSDDGADVSSAAVGGRTARGKDDCAACRARTRGYHSVHSVREDGKGAWGDGHRGVSGGAVTVTQDLRGHRYIGATGRRIAAVRFSRAAAESAGDFSDGVGQYSG